MIRCTAILASALMALAGCDSARQVPNTNGLFGPRQVIAEGVPVPGAVYAGDLDSDGDSDVLLASQSFAWYENLDGGGRFGGPTVIADDARLAESAVLADLDDDGDLDVLTAFLPAWRSGALVWAANIDGRGGFSPWREISGLSVAHGWVLATDLDLDGDDDALALIGVRNSIIAWFENRSPQSFSTSPRVVTDKVQASEAAAVADLDGDGDPDLLLADGGGIGWHANRDGSGSFGPWRTITEAHGAYSLVTADLDDDGDLDVLAGGGGGALGLSGATVAWYENLDGRGSFGAEPRVTVASPGGAQISVADLDDDGDLDVLTATRRTLGLGGVYWYANTDGRGGLGPARPIADGEERADAAVASDLDGDGDLDVLTFYHPRLMHGVIAWHENRL